MHISIIIPVFNTWHNIEKIIKTLFYKKKSFKFEIILIDDCSYDPPKKIIKKIKKIKNVKIFFLKKNFGPGIARDFGIRKSNGKFIWFIDSDDIPSVNWSDTFDKFKKKKTLVDFVVFPAEIKFLGVYKKSIQDYFKIRIGKRLSIKKLFKKNFNFDNFNCTIWQYWFKKSFLLKNNIFFFSGKNYEDASFLSRVFFHSNHFLKMSNVCYTHIRRKKSISSSISLLNPNLEFYKDILKTLTMLIKLSNSPKKNNNINKFFTTRVAKYTMQLASYLNSIKKNKSFFETIEMNWKKNVSKLEKKKIFYFQDKSYINIYKLFLTASIKNLINFYFSKNNLPIKLQKKQGKFAIHCYSPYSLSWLKILNNKNFKCVGIIDSYEHGFKDRLFGNKVVNSVKKIKSSISYIIVINRQKTITKKIINHYIKSGFEKTKLFQIHV